MCNADALSHLPLPDCPINVPMLPQTIALLEQLASVPLTTTQICKMTNHNPVLAKMKQYLLNGWPATVMDKQLQTYSSKRDELSVEVTILLWGSRVMDPSQNRDTVMKEAHSVHIGIS